MEHYGKTLKQLRKARNLSQQELSVGIMSRSNLSRFENQEYIPSFDKVILLLEKLGVEMDEFIYINNQYQTTLYEQLYDRLIYAENRRNHAELMEVAAKITERKEKNRRFYELYLLSQLALLENDLRSELTTDQISLEMRAVILDTENWLFEDFRRLNNFLGMFDREEAVFLYGRAVKEFEKYEEFPRENNIRIYLALNLGQLLAEQEQGAQATFYFEQAKEYAGKRNKLFQQLTIEASLEKLSQPQIASEENRGFLSLLAVLEQMGYEDTVASLKKYYS
ncbi:Rgg/GadR/MutR family transcriptional regulator [Candidatus Enterococcus clewellii]|uniref:HTH cro/C1-type domain-containing protein n=1 Tax=Candidatus Enterococcus clewellii TaxID=1834193 RepID=A0A242K7Y9_9ENTE|nr:Rgg/GadR/MutR family transcriptional regulator [Enterococcus sp. 9E7_DIV0242]OTP17189.1 hypothetical protein A5888_001327 [Enterococcus sp. 9E7_DIV0242]